MELFSVVLVLGSYDGAVEWLLKQLLRNYDSDGGSGRGNEFRNADDLLTFVRKMFEQFDEKRRQQRKANEARPQAKLEAAAEAARLRRRKERKLQRKKLRQALDRERKLERKRNDSAKTDGTAASRGQLLLGQRHVSGEEATRLAQISDAEWADLGLFAQACHLLAVEHAACYSRACPEDADRYVQLLDAAHSTYEKLLEAPPEERIAVLQQQAESLPEDRVKGSKPDTGCAHEGRSEVLLSLLRLNYADRPLVDWTRDVFFKVHRADCPAASWLNDFGPVESGLLEDAPCLLCHVFPVCVRTADTLDARPATRLQLDLAAAVDTDPMRLPIYMNGGIDEHESKTVAIPAQSPEE
eukprot:TRINITY_DN9028_c0_g1_i2.p1 TRINITY_DN9028_c0_g1~~TRINITY_DN9028_c0_g1_i2.p1  ORF type:complete len:355 (-),score=107.27 TRINITY_DN9028_c0_g1_i2:249-1313(-)